MATDGIWPGHAGFASWYVVRKFRLDRILEKEILTKIDWFSTRKRTLCNWLIDEYLDWTVYIWVFTLSAHRPGLFRGRPRDQMWYGNALVWMDEIKVCKDDATYQPTNERDQCDMDGRWWNEENVWIEFFMTYGWHRWVIIYNMRGNSDDGPNQTAEAWLLLLLGRDNPLPLIIYKFIPVSLS